MCCHFFCPLPWMFKTSLAVTQRISLCVCFVSFFIIQHLPNFDADIQSKCCTKHFDELFQDSIKCSFWFLCCFFFYFFGIFPFWSSIEGGVTQFWWKRIEKIPMSRLFENPMCNWRILHQPFNEDILNFASTWESLSIWGISRAQ